MKKLIFIFITITVLQTVFCEEILKYDQYIKIIEEKLPDIKINQNEIKKQKIAYNKSFSTYDVNANLKAYGQGSQTYPDNEDVTYKYSPTFGSELTLTNKLPSGTELSTGFTYTQSYSSRETSTTNSATGEETTTEWQKTTYNPVVTLGVTQPLLYNWFGFLDRYGTKNEKNNLKIETLNQQLNNESLLTDYKKLYFEWIAIKSKLELLENTIANIKMEYNQTMKKVELGLLEKDDLETAKYSLLQYEKQNEEYFKEYEYLANQLSYFINLDDYEPDIEFFENNFNEKYSIEIDFIDFSNTQNALILNLTKENYELLKKANINKVMPSLDLFANLDINFRYSREVNDGEVSEYYYNDNNYKNIDFTAGIELTVPLGNISARNNLKEAKLLIEDIILEYEKTKISYDNNISNIISYNNYLKKIIENNTQSIKTLTNKYKIQKDNFSKGLSDIDELVQTDNSITSEKINQINYKVNIINNFIDYEYLTK